MNLLSYFGGKSRSSSWIYSQITEEMKKEVKTFTEVFSGAFWVATNEDFSFCDTIIYNDMNSYLTNFFASCKEPKFIEYLQENFEEGNKFHYDVNIKEDPKESYDFNYARFKEIFLGIRQELYKDMEDEDIEINIPDYDKALKYGFMLRHAFSGIPSKKIGFSYSASSYKEGKKVPEPKSQILLRNIVKDKVKDNLDSITSFETLDFEEHINKYDSKQSLFYVDPPYFAHEGDYYRGDEYFGKAGHQRLADVLTKIDGKFILSYYDFPGLEEMYPKDKYTWKVKAFNKASSSNVKDTTKDKKGYEVLIMNYNPDVVGVVNIDEEFWT